LYALELETQRVWDYAGDGYVHRLIQNRSDGKLVELPSASGVTGAATEDNRSRNHLGPTQEDRLAQEKVEAIGIEYSYLLTSQLDTQRAYYEEQTAELEGQLTEAQAQIASLNSALKEVTADAAERIKEEEESVASIQKSQARAEAKAEKMGELARRLEKELKEERVVSQGLLENVARLRTVADDAEKERKLMGERLRECEDQLRDVMFFLEAREKITSGEGVEAEASGGTVELPPAPSVKQQPKKKRGRK
jgi:BRCA1-associated protein